MVDLFEEYCCVQKVLNRVSEKKSSLAFATESWYQHRVDIDGEEVIFHVFDTAGKVRGPAPIAQMCELLGLTGFSVLWVLYYGSTTVPVVEILPRSTELDGI